MNNVLKILFFFLCCLSANKLNAQQDSLKTENLSDIIVSASASYDTKKLKAGVIALSIEDVFKIPAAFFDPARLAQTFSGVANTNDQANGLSIRGNNPSFLKWYLEGAEVVNPNHTNNAGTFSDKPSQSSGGVNILSAQLLNTSQLYKGNYPVMYNNALSGILSMSLRPGSFNKRKYVFQAGLIGLEAAAEGPMGKQNKMSYLINYRYSTVGLLSQMGLDFGGESIAFQDLSMVFAFLTKNGLIKTFALSGYSTNDFLSSENPEEWEIQKDQFNISYDNLMTAFGISWAGKGKKGFRFNSSLVYSTLDTKRESDFVNQNLQIDAGVELDKRKENKLSFLYNRSKDIKKGQSVEWGFRSVLTSFEFNQKDLLNPLVFSGDDRYFENALHAQYTLQQKEFLSLKLGINLKHLSFNKIDNQEILLEPRFSYVLSLKKKQSIVLTGGFYSQVNPHSFYFTEGALANNENLKQTKSATLSLTYLKELPREREISFDLFSQRLLDVPVGKDLRNDVSLINGSEDFRYLQISNRGEGLNYGLECAFEQKNSKANTYRPYYIINATLYQARFRNNEEEEWRDTKFNGSYIFNLTGGKAFKNKKPIKANKKYTDKKLGFNLHINYLGGFRNSPIDLVFSEQNQKTIYEKDALYTLKQKDYFRIDGSFYIEKTKPKVKSRLSLDIQNLMNQQNTAFTYYDTFQNAVVEQKQLGIIPVLNYRLEF